jgi:hypothetical protein
METAATLGVTKGVILGSGWLFPSPLAGEGGSPRSAANRVRATFRELAPLTLPAMRLARASPARSRRKALSHKGRGDVDSVSTGVTPAKAGIQSPRG